MPKRHKSRHEVCFCLGAIPLFFAVAFSCVKLYNSCADNKLQNYLKNTLIPKYGLAEGKNIGELLAEREQTLCSGKWERREGIYQARIIDIDNNYRDELLILRYEKIKNSLRAITEVFSADSIGRISAYDCSELERGVKESDLDEGSATLEITLSDNGLSIEVSEYYNSELHAFAEGIFYRFEDGKVYSEEMYIS